MIVKNIYVIERHLNSYELIRNVGNQNVTARVGRMRFFIFFLEIYYVGGIIIGFLVVSFWLFLNIIRSVYALISLLGLFSSVGFILQLQIIFLVCRMLFL